jgi:microcystin-dependent protein
LIPDAPQFVEAVNEVLSLLTYPDVWQAGDGTMTAQECAMLMATMWNEYRKDHLCMLGVIVPITTAVVPDGMLLCDGSTYNGNDYPDLWEVISPVLRLEAGGGKTLLMPDLRGRFIMGGDQESPQEFTEGGAAEVTLEISQLPSHHHTIEPHQHTYTGDSLATVPSGADPLIPASFVNPLPSLTGLGGTPATNTTGGGGAHNNIPPYYVLRYAMIAR